MWLQFVQHKIKRQEKSNLWSTNATIGPWNTVATHGMYIGPTILSSRQLITKTLKGYYDILEFLFFFFLWGKKISNFINKYYRVQTPIQQAIAN